AYRTQAKKIEQLAFFGSMLVLLLAIVAIGATIWQIQTAQAASEAAAVEQRALTRGQEELRLFADNVPAMATSHDENLRYIFANKRYADFFGFSQADLVGRHLREVIGEEAYREIDG